MSFVSRTLPTKLRPSKPVWQLPRFFHSVYHADSPAVDSSLLENKVLARAYEKYVPERGFSQSAVREAARELNLNPDVLSPVLSVAAGDTIGLEMQLALYHLRSRRAKLAEYHEEAQKLASETEKVRFYLGKRLQDNVPVIGKYHQALAQMIMPSNVTASLEELHKLSDDITYFAGDKSNDFAWYSKRFSLSGVIVQSEIFMLTDSSADFAATTEFMNDRLDEVDNLGYAYSSFEEWVLFNGISTVNLFKSQLARG